MPQDDLIGLKLSEDCPEAVKVKISPESEQTKLSSVEEVCEDFELVKFEICDFMIFLTNFAFGRKFLSSFLLTT